MKAINDHLNEIELGKYLDLTNDYAFKLIFGAEKNKHILIEMINDFLPDRKIVSLEFQDKERQGLTPDNKAVRFDLHCKDEKGQSFIVEIQKTSIKNFYYRVLYYASLLYSSNIISGDKKFESAKPVYVITFLCAPLKDAEFQGLNDLILWYQMCEKTHKCFAPNGINIIFANIFRASSSLEECKTESEKWCTMIRDMSKYQCEPHEIGTEKWENLAELSKLALYDNSTIVGYIKTIMDAGYNDVLIEESYEDGLTAGRAEGEAKGRAEGEAKGAAESKVAIANAMLSNNISIDVISSCTGLSREEVLQLQHFS